ncbi:MAG TPA: hypothetical protein VM487_08875 [Phycisphaerae bacterium]|nr:hypothetical protein [Phycisphaerae bacterium]
MNKRTCLSLLVCVNLVLLTAIVLFAYSPPAALAQGTGLAGNYLVVTGEIQNEYDALYLIEMRSRTLHVFYYDKTRKELYYSDVRSLERDFRHNRD